MRDYSKIEVMEGAVHILEPHQGSLTLTHGLLDMTDDVGQFLADHVKRGLGDSKAAAANFVGRDEGHAGPTAWAILSGDQEMLDASAALARLLYEASEGDARVSDGTLAVLRCSARDEEDFVAMLKLDPSDHYSAVVDENDDGNEIVRLVVRSDVLPSVRERVQKSAFVRGKDNEYDMLMVDRQRPGGVVSRFFVQDFLRAELAMDARRRTEQLIRGLNRAQNEVAHQLETSDAKRLRRYLDGQMTGARVNTDDLVDGLPVSDNFKGPFRSHLDDVLPDRDFELDDDVVKKTLRRRSYKGDNGLVVSANADGWNDMVEATYDEQRGTWQISIQTSEWRLR